MAVDKRTNRNRVGKKDSKISRLPHQYKLIDGTHKWKTLAKRLLEGEDLTPLEVMLLAMRIAWTEVGRQQKILDEAIASGDKEAIRLANKERRAVLREASWLADRAAPYMHPRLNATRIETDNAPLTIELVQFVAESKATAMALVHEHDKMMTANGQGQALTTAG